MLRELTFSTSPRCWIMASRMSSRSYSNGILSRTFSNCSATAWLLLIAGIYFFSSVVIPFATFFRLKNERAGDRGRFRRPPILPATIRPRLDRSEEHTSELQSLAYLVCRLLLEKKNKC